MGLTHCSISQMRRLSPAGDAACQSAGWLCSRRPCPHPGLPSSSCCHRPALVHDGSGGVSRIPPPAGRLAGLRKEELGRASLPRVWGRGSCDSPQGSRTGREGGFLWGNQSPERQQLPPSPQGYDFLAQDGPGPHFMECCLLTNSLC